ncbi:glycosyltransferase family 2 protein [Candidatus Microgenomates bacterium]|nr:glycosyltransferase family 2 protein [Candidatus Microgenomates bacterium]
MKKPVISVIIPAYNEEGYLFQCLTALKNQDFKLSYEIIVIDNNSTDKTPQIAQKFGTRVVFEKQKGVIFAKQKGLLSAKAEIIAVCDADTKPPKNWLSTIHQSLNETSVVGVGGPVKVFDGPAWHKNHVDLSFSLVKILSKINKGSVYLMGNNLAFKKRAFLASGGYDIRLSMGEDEWGVLKKLKKMGKVIFNPQMINYASGRRANNGFFYLFFYELPIKYALNYFLSSILKRQIIKPFADIR